ncbi:MAG: hypothetical protein GTO24_24390, partial [candidate division Zixibacteria bacterium]|nr:hypothetical protein [candidate division Zixibacteria bacterium]
MRHLGFAVFAPVGGLLATVNLALPYLASSVGIFMSGLVAMTLIEPPRHAEVTGVAEPKVGRKSYYEIQKSLALILDQKRLLWFVLFFSVIFLATRLGFWT